MLTAVYFDLDRTLFDRDASFRQFLESQHAKYAHALGGIEPERYVSRIETLDNRGRVWKDTVYQTVVEEFELHGLAWEVLFEDFITRFSDYCQPFPGLRETMAELKRDGYRLGVITNGFEEFQLRLVQSLGIRAELDTIVISEREGIRKPDPEIFRRALRRLDAAPETSVFVGDHPVIDIGGAAAAGMRTIWKRNADFAEPAAVDAAIDQLSELPETLARLAQRIAS